MANTKQINIGYPKLRRFNTPPCNRKRRESKMKFFVNSCPRPVTPDINFNTLSAKKRYADRSILFQTAGITFNDRSGRSSEENVSIKTVINFLTETQTKIRSELIVVDNFLEMEKGHLKSVLKFMGKCSDSKLAPLISGGTIKDHEKTLEEIDCILESSKTLQKSFISQQRDLFEIIKSLKKKQADIEAKKRRINKIADQLLKGFFETERKERIRRRREAIGLELEIEYLNEYEETCFMIKNEVVEMIPKLKDVSSRFLKRVKQLVAGRLDCHAKLLLTTNGEKVKGSVDIVRVKHSHVFGSDGVPIFID